MPVHGRIQHNDINATWTHVHSFGFVECAVFRVAVCAIVYARICAYRKPRKTLHSLCSAYLSPCERKTHTHAKTRIPLFTSREPCILTCFVLDLCRVKFIRTHAQSLTHKRNTINMALFRRSNTQKNRANDNRIIGTRSNGPIRIRTRSMAHLTFRLASMDNTHCIGIHTRKAPPTRQRWRTDQDPCDKHVNVIYIATHTHTNTEIGPFNTQFAHYVRFDCSILALFGRTNGSACTHPCTAQIHIHKHTTCVDDVRILQSHHGRGDCAHRIAVRMAATYWHKLTWKILGQ